MVSDTRPARDAENPAPAAAGDRRGPALIRARLPALPTAPGVYRMRDDAGGLLYVGKAKNLRRRLTSYANPAKQTPRIRRMVDTVAEIEVTTTHTEVEALLLESNQIKRLKPRYNVLLRDDKSFPYILIADDHDWPQIAKHRGSRKRPGEYFGPFASAGAVNQTLAVLERAFPLRSCSDSIFAARTRPCLQYQIKRCSGPCAGKIARADYLALVDEARDFLAGRSRDLQTRLAARMQAASAALDFETAAALRDRIRALTRIQAHQEINIAGLGEADVIAAHREANQTCIQVFFFRAGQNYGNRPYFPRHARQDDIANVLAAFIGQFYVNKPIPAQVLVSHALPDQTLIGEALSAHAGRKVTLTHPRRGAKRRIVGQAETNAAEALTRRMAETASQRRLLDGVARVFGLESPPRRIEVYDNSHFSGGQAVGAMIVAGPEGFEKNAYRRFTIRRSGPGTEASAGDDYAMMREVLNRRFLRALKDDAGRESGQWPDLLLIDGGRGQLNAVRETLADLGIADLPTAAISKGPARNAGRENFHVPDRPPFDLPAEDPVLYYLQRLRDEAHRFAIGGHRAKRGRRLSRSTLDDIAGIGPARKRALLHHFGSAREVAEVGLDDLAEVEGVSAGLARRIYDHFHGAG
ncbi:MAG: excinuclease ABC subunit UvrC [Alphaproteobacteria bacterium]